MTPIILVFGQSNGQNLWPHLRTVLGESEIDAIALNAAVGGAGVARPDAPWNITVGDGSDEPGSAYTAMTEAIDTALAENPDSYIAAAVWSQGEGDTFRGGGVDYFNPAKEVFEATFDYIGSEIPTFILGITDYIQIQRMDGVDAVQAQQQELADAFDNVHYLSTDEIMDEAGLTRETAMRDALHYFGSTNYLFAEKLLEQPEMRKALGLEEEELPVEPTPEPEEEAESDGGDQPPQEDENSETPDRGETSADTDESGEDTGETSDGDLVVNDPETNVIETQPPVETPQESEPPVGTTNPEAGSNDSSMGVAGIGLGLSALGAAVGVYAISLIGLLAVVFLGRNKGEDENSEDDVSLFNSDENTSDVLLSDILPVTQQISDDDYNSDASDTTEMDPFLL